MNRIGDKLHHTGTNKRLVAAFYGNDVEFVVVGGLAVAWYCTHREADDMDLLINPAPENSARVSDALKSLGLSGFTPRCFARSGLQVPLKQTLYAELLTPRVTGQTYNDVAASSQPAKLFDFPVWIASPGSLIRMKREAISEAEAERDKHLADIKCLARYESEC